MGSTVTPTVGELTHQTPVSMTFQLVENRQPITVTAQVSLLHPDTAQLFASYMQEFQDGKTRITMAEEHVHADREAVDGAELRIAEMESSARDSGMEAEQFASSAAASLASVTEKEAAVVAMNGEVTLLKQATDANAVATAADRHQTGLDKVEVASSASAALSSANQATEMKDQAVSASASATSAATAAAASAAAADSSQQQAAGFADISSVNANEANDAAFNATQFYNQFRNAYYGPMLSDPLVDPFGNAPSPGDLYFSTAIQQLRVYSTNGWSNLKSGLESQVDIFASELGPTSLTHVNFNTDMYQTVKGGGTISLGTISDSPYLRVGPNNKVGYIGIFSSGLRFFVSANAPLARADALNSTTDSKNFDSPLTVYVCWYGINLELAGTTFRALVKDRGGNSASATISMNENSIQGLRTAVSTTGLSHTVALPEDLEGLHTAVFSSDKNSQTLWFDGVQVDTSTIATPVQIGNITGSRFGVGGNRPSQNNPRWAVHAAGEDLSYWDTTKAAAFHAAAVAEFG